MTEDFGENRREKALRDLEDAKAELEQSERLEVEAREKVARALRELEAADEYVDVHVIHVNDVKRASFEERLTTTLERVWDRSYEELHIPRRAKDTFQTAGDDPRSLMTHLQLTLREAKQRHVIEDFRFAIVSETGGA